MGCYTLFATHYFELTQLPDRLDNAVNVHLTATEHEDSIVFLHNVHEGPASQSYGLQVARLAGVPPGVIRNAHQQLQHLEGGELKPVADMPKATATHQGDMFAALEPSAVESELLKLDVDGITPRDALSLLYALKGRLQNEFGPG